MKYLYFGLWNGIVIMLAELFAPVNKKVAGGFFKLTGLREKGIFATCLLYTSGAFDKDKLYSEEIQGSWNYHGGTCQIR